MSDETTNASDNLNGSDPSMEDILASIRKIISDDEPVALESPEDISADGGPLDSVLDAAATAGSAAAGATVAAADFSAAEGESVDLNIDDVLAGLEEDIPAPAQELQSAASAIDIADGDMVDDDAFSNVLDDILTDEAKTYSLDETDGLPDAEDDILSLLDDEIPLEVESSAGVMPELVPDVPTEAPIEVAGLEDLASEVESLTDVESLMDGESLAEVESLGDDEPDDIEALLNGLLGDDDPLPIEDPIETLIEDDPIEAPVEEGPIEALAEEDPIEALAEDDPIETLLEDSIEDVDLDADELSAADLADSNAAPSGVEETEELELVKSLMADLSDDPAAVDAIDTDEDLESLLSIPDADEVSADTSDAEAESDGDILGDIVDMAIEDEMQTHPEDLAALEDLVAEEEVLSEIAETEDLSLLDDVIEAEQENIAENAQLAAETAVEESPSLSDIATAAEADAVAVETAAMPAAAVAGAGALAGLTAVVAARAPEETPEEETPEEETSVEISDETPEINPSVSQAEPVELKNKLTLEPLPNQEIEMPVKAVQTDAILDDVTESATAGAFAELNQVVEDKAVFNERGPRIGDLVQDALRPMLKEWLDANLKGIVERAVTKEVKRISSGK